ncbi:MFS transporter [Krasilnikovia sp. MM14-A1259]|uniref:MFS transporter n=1 Tax=Krasilnikovia sp. MM14-A1259 TaxID=3373539 RepID=UPI00399C87DB
MSDDTPAAPSAHPADAVSPERQVTFRDVFAVREYRAMYSALLVNWIGDYLARAAITVLVYQRTESVMLSAASFAIGYLPWIAGGPLLAALAERYPYRRVMVICDLSRMALMALVAVPQIPVPALLVVVFLAMLAGPPTQAARSALLPLLLGRDRMVVALAVNTTTAQAAQVFGYFVGATVAAAVNPRLAIAMATVGFGLSAALLLSGVRARPAAVSPAQRAPLLRETGEGFKIVFGTPVLAAIGALAVTLTIFAIVPEGLAAAWAAQGNPDPATRGLHQGMIMAAGPVGWVIGGVLISRFVRPSVRQRLIRPLAVAAPMALVPALAAPPAQVVALLTLLSGIAQGGLLPTLNAMFVLALPHGFRARAFAVIQGSMQLAQGGAVLATGLLAEHAAVPTVVGLWSVGGTLLMAALAARWPRTARFEAAIAAAAESAPAPPAAAPQATAPSQATPPMTAPPVAAPQTATSQTAGPPKVAPQNAGPQTHPAPGRPTTPGAPRAAAGTLDG